MISRRLVCLLSPVLPLTWAVTAAAGTLTPIAPYVAPGAPTYTSLLGINNDGWTTGSVINYTNNTISGFLRSPTGDYTLFGTPSQSFYGRAVSNTNTVTGYTNTSGFERTADGTITLLYHPADGGPQSGVPLAGIAQGINDAGTIVGNYRAHSGPTGTGPIRNHGYILAAGSFTELTDPTEPFASVNARGIADNGTVVGFQSDADNGLRGLVYAGSTLSYYAHPGDLDASGLHTTVFEAINNRGVVLGGYTDPATGDGRAFSFDPVAHSFTDIVVPGAMNVQTFGINDAGQYVVSSDAGQFIYSPDGPTAPDGSSVFMPVAGGPLPPGQAQFSITVAPGTTYYIDPSYAHGFEYLAGSGPLFDSVTAPSGVGVGNHLALYLWDGTAYVFARTLTGGVAFDFTMPVDRFELRGIPDGAMIDPAHPTGFVTGLTFAGPGTFDGFQNALTATIPEPATWSLIIAGFGAIGAALRRRGATAVDA